jgi:hypothetical protein
VLVEPTEEQEEELVGFTTRGLYQAARSRFKQQRPSQQLCSVHTLRDVNAGEELTDSTIYEGYLMNTFQRAEVLETRGIMCKCAACNPSSAISDQHEKLRMMANDGYYHLKNMTEAWPDYFDTASASKDATSTTLYASTTPTISLFEVAEKLVLNLVVDLRKLQCASGSEIVDVFNVLVHKINPRLAANKEGDEVMTRWRLIDMHSSLALKAAKICCGEDSTEYKECLSRS